VIGNFKLDRLFIIPAAKPPHKVGQAVSQAYHRYTMAVLATMDIPSCLVSAIEIEAPDKPYTFQTLDRLRAICGPQSELFFIMGSDSFEELHTWQQPERILSAASIIVAARPGYELNLACAPYVESIIDLRRHQIDVAEIKQQAGLVYLTDYVWRDISSTEIRRRVREGLSVSGLVPASVEHYIEKYELYTGS
jgi:nicotinate-nucleotide adenylyltransferase